MNAGLLGEHLASPRTATKTNQSTALDPKTAKGGNASGKDDFASHVAKDPASSREDAPATESALAATQTSEDVNPQPDIQALPLDAALASEDAALADDASVETVKLVVAEAADAPNTALQQAPDAELGTARRDAQSLPLQSVRTEEITAQDARIRPQGDLRDGGRDSRRPSDTDLIRTTSTAIDDVAVAPDADQPDLAVDTLEPGRPAPRSSDADVLRAPPAATADDTLAANASETSFRQTVSTDITAIDRLASGGITRDASTVIADTIPTVAPTPSSGTGSAPITGLTPTVPTIPLASPGDLTSVILNAINNGIDPQEQLVVQLDPPELGRVMIDFKFDAQGLQQIIVTSENPEALKRLREMHFELTQALREHGLSEQNMTFREQADGDDWNSNEPLRHEAQFYAAEERRASPSALPTESRTQARDRLDLLL